MSILCLPKLVGRGAGLANELIPWAKAYLAAETLGGRCLPPAWGFNPRRYWRNFGGSRLDAPLRRLLQAAYPITLTFDEATYRAHYHPDFGCAVSNWYRTLRLPKHAPVLCFFEGMWGGVRAVERSRMFLLAQLYRTRHTLRNVFQKLPPSGSRPCLRVGVHYRCGDFGEPFQPGDGKSRWNRRLPLSWYLEACRQLQREFGGDVEFLLVTDAFPQECRPFLETFDPTTTFDQQLTEVSDLLLLSGCDLILPSLSSYTIMAIALGNAAYLWPTEHLILLNECWTLWGDEAEQQGGETRESSEMVRAGRVTPERSRALAYSGQAFPPEFISMLRQRLAFADPNTDLVKYGALPATARGIESTRTPVMPVS